MIGANQGVKCLGKRISAATMDLVWEWIKHLARPYPRHLRDMGYVEESRNLAARQDRCRAAWQPHLECTRSLILEAADRCCRFERALIVGSGLLFDIPSADLSRRFREVILVDILHPWRVRKAVHSFDNVRLASVDITGAVEKVHAATAAGRGLDVSVCRPDFFLDDDVDLVVSVNLLSQLPVIPNGYVARRHHGLAPGAIREFSRRLVIGHLDWLASFACNVCLVSDLERLYCDGEDVVEREESLWGVNLPGEGREWIWELAPRPEIEWSRDIRHRVVGYAEFPKHAWRKRRQEFVGE